MNKSKKILGGKPNEKSKPIVKKDSNKKNKNIILLSSLAIIIVCLVIGIFYDAFRPKVLLTLNGEKYTVDDLMYNFYTTELTYQSVEDFYKQYMQSGSYWDSLDETGTMTNRMVALNDVIDLSIQTELLYSEATKKGYTLTEQEITDTDAKVDDILNKNLTPAQLKKTGFNVDNLTEAITKATIAARYRQDIIDSFNITDEEVKATVDYEKYRQYDIEYFYVRTNSQDAEGNTIELTVNEKNALMDKLTTFLETAKDADDWKASIPEGEEDIMYNAKGFTSGISGFPTEFEDLIKSLDNGAITEPTVADNGIYAVRMVNNNSSEKYDSEVQSARSNMETSRFNEYFAELLSGATYSVNKNTLSSIYMGEVTL